MSPEWWATNRKTILETSPGRDWLEPSGLTVHTDRQGQTWLYLVSDNGKIARGRRHTGPADKWTVQDCGPTKGFEAVTATRNKLMIGVEGRGKKGKVSNARIRRFNPAATGEGPLGSFTGSLWALQDLPVGPNAGLEALAFVPDGALPVTWPASSHYGGLFFVASQQTPGALYVYDLPKGNRATHEVAAIMPPLKLPSLPRLRVSDCFFSPETGLFYVLYDDAMDWLQELELNRTTGELVERRLHPLPFAGCEAVAVHGRSLYLGLDQKKDEMKRNKDHGLKRNKGYRYNYVFAYPEYTAAE